MSPAVSPPEPPTPTVYYELPVVDEAATAPIKDPTPPATSRATEQHHEKTRCDDTHDVGRDGDVYNRVYSREGFEEEAHGIAGKIIKSMGLFGYIFLFIVPLAYVAIFFAIIPLGQPQVPTIKEQGVFLFVSNVFIMIAISYLYNATFLGLANAERPFRTSVIPLLAVFVVEIALFAPILLTHGVFDWLGIVALSACYFTLFFSMLVAYPDLRKEVHSFFRRFMLLLILYIPLLSGFVIAYRETESSALQSFLSFAFAFITFIYRRVMLSRLDPFPLDLSQLLAGFWVQNLGDSTFILAFPQVRSPSVYAALFLSSSLQNIAFLIFVSDLWIYKIRPVLKTYALSIFACRFPIPPIPKPDESFDPNNRGHDANVGGYRRRQFRFFFFRLLSQAISMLMYLGISPMLRFGLNKEFTPLAGFTIERYRNSMIFAASNFGFIMLVLVIGYVYLHRRHHATFHEIREIHLHDLLHHTMVGMVIAIITHNMILTLAIILSHYCIFASFKLCMLSVPFDS
eukprot:GFKZ01013576.1.p1 GENE.GFKZ01013576.1~~GFKZ01013576.1.p1  ORF type:complete len:570 (-),score=44.55 GFKZ01013576.1:1316-2857(-)